MKGYRKDNVTRATGRTELPSQPYAFGGFTAGTSRNGNATPNEDPLNEGKSYSYIKDSSTGGAITGWRVFDVNGDDVKLISAGNPEDYVTGGYTSSLIGPENEYILTGNENVDFGIYNTAIFNMVIRNWKVYINKKQRAIRNEGD